MRALLLISLAWSACAPPTPPPPGPPDAPVLDAVAGPVATRRFRLTGTAPADTVVWVFVDDACAGPVLAETTAEALATGVEIELLASAVNTLSALAISSSGLRSACSAPVLVEVEELARPGTPALASRPVSPAATETFALYGFAPVDTTVRLHAFDCSSVVLDELPAAEFATTGFLRIVRDGSTSFFAVDVVSASGEVSDCSQPLLIEADLQPPRVATLRLLSPTPSPNQQAWISVSGDFERMQLVPAADCAGAPDFETNATFCGAFGSCALQVLTFPADATTPWSVECADGAGNRACFNATEPWTHDSRLPAASLELTRQSSTRRMAVRVPFGVDEVELTESEDCTGPIVEMTDVRSAMSYGLRTLAPIDGGVFTVYGWSYDGGGATPCSRPLR